MSNVEIRKKKWLILALVWASTAFLVWPILRHRAILVHSEWRTHWALGAGYIIAALVCLCFYRTESRRGLDRSRNLILVILIVLLTCFVNQIHHYFVDQGALFSYATNLVWQERLQMHVAKLNPAVAPHSYRFLPNGIVLWMQLLRINFDAARDIYRWICGLFLFYAIYRYARLYTDYLGAILALLLVAVVYPMSFESYAGQLTDPLSHLSFVLAFIFLETGDFEYLLATLLIGSLAKETVLALSGFYVLFCYRDKRYLAKAVTLCVASLAAYFGVRFLVLHGTMQYGQVSGVQPEHILDNLSKPDWPMAAAILLAYLVFLVLGWKETPGSLKRLALYLIPVLLVSNVFFGWLRETRNYMPAVFVLSVIAGRYISRRCVAAECPAADSLVQT